MQTDDLNLVTEQINAGAGIATVEPSLIEHMWKAMSSIPSKLRQGTSTSLHAVASADPGCLPENPEQRVGMTITRKSREVHRVDARTLPMRLGMLLVTITAVLAQWAQAQQQKRTVITEPGTYELADFFKHADIVALVRIVSGDTENYNVAVYKAEVITSFKGTAAKETIYFGPYTGTRLGWEYIVFLHNVSKPLEPDTAQNVGYGPVHYAEVLNQGYGSMESSYQCVFDGKSLDQHCDYGVRVCTDYIKLPKKTATFPPETNETPFGCRQVRKTDFISLLETINNPKK